MPSIVYVDCPTCGVEVVLIKVEREIGPQDVLEPHENLDLQEAIYGQVVEPGDAPPEVVAVCPEGHALMGAMVQAKALED
jgi:hypothetical protein